MGKVDIEPSKATIKLFIIGYPQEAFRDIPKELRKCLYPDEGELVLFSHYTEANCQLECAWARAEATCGCRPWHVPRPDTWPHEDPSIWAGDTCWVLGHVCWDQTMARLQQEADDMQVTREAGISRHNCCLEISSAT